jgi:hypothetical protein
MYHLGRKEEGKLLRRIQFALLVLIALMLGALIFMVDSSPGWDDTGVSAFMILTASGLLGALHPQRAWVWALAVGTWVPLRGLILKRSEFEPASVLAVGFALAGAYGGALIGKLLRVANTPR